MNWMPADLMVTDGVGPAALWMMLLLGAYHGINPGMGWLFAVALGLQAQKGGAVARALPPMALGHALAIAVVVLAAALLGAALPLGVLRVVVGAVLIGLGGFWLVRHRHPRWVRMQVGFGDLTLWSFLVASAHGAGLMVVPVLLGSSQVHAAGHPGAHHHGAAAGGAIAGLLATAVHTAGYLAVSGLIAWVVYRKLGLALLRKAWFNVDRLWAAALVVSGAITLVM
jgi:hypothetical protein